MQIRRVKGYDGGNHLVSDVLQYRQAGGEAWRDVLTMGVQEAMLADMVEGIIKPEDFAEYGEAAVSNWRNKMADAKARAASQSDPDQ